MRSRIFKAELLFGLVGLVLAGAFAGPAWAPLGALAGLLAWLAIKKGASLLLLKALRSAALWFALLGSIAGALAGGLLWALACAAGGFVATEPPFLHVNTYSRNHATQEIRICKPLLSPARKAVSGKQPSPGTWPWRQSRKGPGLLR